MADLVVESTAVAVDTPYLFTSDPSAAIAFVARLTSAERHPVESVDQLLLGADLRTAAGGLRYTWPAMSQTCSCLCPGAADVIAALSGRRRSYTPNPSAAASVFNMMVNTQYSRIGQRLLMVDADERLVYRVTSMTGRIRGSAANGEILRGIFAAAADCGFEMVTAFGPVGRVDIAFALPPEPTVLPLPVAPAAVVRPYIADTRLFVYPAVRIGNSVLPGRQAGPRKSVYKPGSWADGAFECLDLVRRRLPGAIARLAEVQLPGDRPETVGPVVVRWLRSHGVASQIAISLVRRLTTGHYPGGRPGSQIVEAAVGARGEWTAADLLMAIAGVAEKYAGRVSAIVSLCRAGYNLATGEAPPSFA